MNHKEHKGHREKDLIFRSFAFYFVSSCLGVIKYFVLTPVASLGLPTGYNPSIQYNPKTA